jgi:hypothetical protein
MEEKKSMNVYEMLVLLSSQVFSLRFYWLKEREVSTLDQWLRVGLRAFQKTFLSTGSQESHKWINRVRLVLTTRSQKLQCTLDRAELCFRFQCCTNIHFLLIIHLDIKFGIIYMRIICIWRMRWAGHVERIGRRGTCIGYW